ncbi:MAG: hypothetical protein AUK44_03145 [Porphyromonadaceae bacterium CG2_30_38_12]|nr:MAG: hypothetical protein AUK44_03145 [Porphyromonadaceae bacterium CG2_30_38_12]
MNTKELISNLSVRCGLSKTDAEQLLETTILTLSELLKAGKSVSILGFGNLEVRKKEERLSVHPATQVRTLIPPKLVVNFKQSTKLKDKLKYVKL